MKAIICIVVLFALLFAAQARRTAVKNVKAVGGTVTCEGCELVIAWAESQLAENATESEIETFLDTLCNDIPSPVRAECENLVQEDTPELIQLLEKDESPQVACTELKICN